MEMIESVFIYGTLLSVGICYVIMKILKRFNNMVLPKGKKWSFNLFKEFGKDFMRTVFG